MNIKNPWIGYFDRTYDQIKDNVLTKFQFLVPEITDHTETNPWVKGISIWAGLMEMLGYYTDNNAREYFLPSAREYASAIKIAKSYDYRVKGAIAATVTLRFFSSIAATGNILIPIGTRVKTSTGEIFSTIAAGTILLGQTFIDIQAKQWDAVVNVALGNSDGSINQFFILEEDVADGSVSINVDVITYTGQDTFAYSIPTDTHFIAGLQGDTKMSVLFGDGINGIVPPSGNAIVASYFITLGSGGNIGAGKINIVLSAIGVPGSEIITVSNASASTGGADFEDLAKLQKRIPLSIRTKWRAVTNQDFIDVSELFGGVERAGVDFDCDTDPFVNIFLVPDGGGLASPTLIADVTNFLNIRRVVNTKIKVQSAGVVNFTLLVNVLALPGYNNALIQTNVQNAILDFFAPVNQLIKGYVQLGDIYQVMEAVQGVQYTNIALITAIPYARNIVTPGNVLNWTRAITPASTTSVKWLLRFISISTFELFREEVFVGSFSVDTPVSQTEINFTVNGNHVSGDNYTFYTYPYNLSTLLLEPSIPSTEIGNLTINVTGGV